MIDVVNQLSEINAKVDDQFKSINEDYNTLDELIEAVHEEYGIHHTVDKLVSGLKKHLKSQNQE